jgi:hypothetical protein
MTELIQVMNDCYDYVNKHTRIIEDDRGKILERLVLRTVDCGYFIRNNSKIEGFRKFSYEITECR